MSSDVRVSDAPLFDVVWPLGKSASSPVDPAPPLADLNGKSICELWDFRFKGDQMYTILNEELRKRFPNVRIVECMAMGNTDGNNEREYVANLPALLREHGCDAVISSVGA
jgi:hypothetical protein